MVQKDITFWENLDAKSNTLDNSVMCKERGAPWARDNVSIPTHIHVKRKFEMDNPAITSGGGARGKRVIVVGALEFRR